MLFFFFSSGQGGSLSVGPLVVFLPLILQLAPHLFQEISSRQLTGSYAATLCALGLACCVHWVLRSGGWSLLLQLLFQGYQGGPTARAGGSTQGQGRFETPQQDGHRVTMEQVTGELMKLPTEQYSTPDQLATLPVHDLKRLIRRRGLDPVICLEKGDLVKQLLEHGGSSAHSCSICCEDYDAGGAERDADVLRVLHCGHSFHLECIDRWLLSATNYSRPPACPLCNAPLLHPQT